jgi:hypothetical protein
MFKKGLFSIIFRLIFKIRLSDPEALNFRTTRLVAIILGGGIQPKQPLSYW